MATTKFSVKPEIAEKLSTLLDQIGDAGDAARAMQNESGANLLMGVLGRTLSRDIYEIGSRLEALMVDLDAITADHGDRFINVDAYRESGVIALGPQS